MELILEHEQFTAEHKGDYVLLTQKGDCGEESYISLHRSQIDHLARAIGAAITASDSGSQPMASQNGASPQQWLRLIETELLEAQAEAAGLIGQHPDALTLFTRLQLLASIAATAASRSPPSEADYQSVTDGLAHE